MLKTKYFKSDNKLVESFTGEMYIVPTSNIYKGYELKGANVVCDERLPKIINELKNKFLSKDISNYIETNLGIMGEYGAVLIHDSFLKVEEIEKQKYIYNYNLEEDSLTKIDFNNSEIVSFYEFSWYPPNYPVYFETVFGIKNIFDVTEIDHYITDKDIYEREYPTENGYSYEITGSTTNEYHLYKKDDKLIFCISQRDNLDNTINSSILTVENLEEHELEKHNFYSHLRDLYNAGEIKELTKEYERDVEDIPF